MRTRRRLLWPSSERYTFGATHANNVDVAISSWRLDTQTYSMVAGLAGSAVAGAALACTFAGIACGGASAAQTGTAARTAPVASGNPSPVVAPAAESQSRADSSSLGKELGQSALDIIANAERVMFAELELVAADEAQDRVALQDPSRIAGYPLHGMLRPLGPGAVDVVTQILTDRRNYALSRRWRCFPDRQLGFRFIRNESSVDASLTDNCSTVIWSFVRDGEPALWGGVLSKTLSARIWELVSQP